MDNRIFGARMIQKNVEVSLIRTVVPQEVNSIKAFILWTNSSHVCGADWQQTGLWDPKYLGLQAAPPVQTLSTFLWMILTTFSKINPSGANSITYIVNLLNLISGPWVEGLLQLMWRPANPLCSAGADHFTWGHPLRQALQTHLLI